MKLKLILILSFFALLVNASDYYITTADLNLRSGAGRNYKSLTVLAKGDTVKMIDSTGNNWVKVQYQDKIGYSAKQYLQPILIPEETDTAGGNTFLIVLILLALTIVVAIILKQSGDKYRSQSTTTLLSFFFGSLGLQKFYLGESNKGVLSILFCWTFIPTLIGLIDFIRYATMNENKFHNKFNGGIKKKNQRQPKATPNKAPFRNQQVITKPTFDSKTNVIRLYNKGLQLNEILNSAIDLDLKMPSGASITNIYQIKELIKSVYPNAQFETVQASYGQKSDSTIIDVNSEKLDLTVEKIPISTSEQLEPPYWQHSYVYSYDAINSASKAQRKFYTYMKNKVLKGEFVDIQGNTNYAFILYFDFLNEYQGHRDIKLLDEQFKLIGEICPKTRSYTLRLLQDELRKRTDSYSVDKLKDLEQPSYQFEYGYSDYNPDLYKLGNQYKDKLGLDKQEIRWLNKFYNPSNVFLAIEGCCVATIMQYVTILKELNQKLKRKETTLAKEVTYFKEKLKTIYENRHSDWNYYGYDTSYLGNQAESEVYLTMFKRIENSVRDSYGHKRKVSGDFPFADKNLSNEFEERIGNLLNTLIDELKSNVGNPDIATQIALNIQNVNRWKIEFDLLKENFKIEEKDNFIEGVIHLEETNQKNQNIENVLFEASKFIAKYDKVQSLKYYAKYIYYDLKSKKFDNRELTKTVQKSLFKTEEQINDFKNIISELIETADIQKALDRIAQIYIPKRKKIKLDKSEIKEVEQKHEGTVELLNEFLESGQEETETLIEESSDEEIEVTILPSKENHSIFKPDINMGKVQEELVKRIISNSFGIHQDEVDKYATENGMFKNQLIDSINEACQELLDGEALIEEDDENYIIEESYYNEIAK